MILTVNAGSSSLRFSLFDKNLNRVYRGHIDAIGLKNSKYRRYFEDGSEVHNKIHFSTHQDALHYALNRLVEDEVIADFKAITQVGHRVVHGGEKFTEPTLLNRKVIRELNKLSSLAPLHNPTNIEGILSAMKHLPKVGHYAIFDTAFHSTIPEKAYLYGLPYSLYKKDRIRRYGFHGTSHKFVDSEARKLIRRKDLKVITCHMGNGVSLAAIRNGKCLDTSMGFTPLEGPMMGTRSGSIDPAIIFHLAKTQPLDKIEQLLQKESGFKGMSGISSDVRELRAKIDSPETQRTFGVFSYQMAKLILGYGATLGGPPDAIVFTAGIGEHAQYLRKMICEQLSVWEVKLDESKNKTHEVDISSSNSRVKILVIPTDEELQMAKEIHSL